jgi:prophage endopeptidase
MIGGLFGKGMAYMLTAAALLAVGFFAGYRLIRDHYLSIIARNEQRFAVERQKLSEAAIKAEHQVIDQERQNAVKFAEIDRRYQQALHHEKARHLAELRTARRLYIDIQPATHGGDGLPPTAACARCDHDPTRAELSSQAARFLVQLAFEADQAVRQLSACQQVVQADRQRE